MIEKNYADCESGACGETRLIRVIGDGIAPEELSSLTAEIVQQMVDPLTGLDDVQGLQQTRHEASAIFAVTTVLDTVLVNMELLPRCLPLGMFHVLSAQEFNDKIGSAVTGAVRQGHAYLRRPTNDIDLISSFMQCLCHETVHLSAAIVVDLERTVEGGVRVLRIKHGLGITDEGKHFVGLDEAVTDRIGNLICSIVYDALGVTDGISESAHDIQDIISGYQAHEAVVDGVCRRLYPKSKGADGWSQLLQDYWGGTSLWLDFVAETWPAAYAVLREMDETQQSALFSVRLLGLKE